MRVYVCTLHAYDLKSVYRRDQANQGANAGSSGDSTHVPTTTPNDPMVTPRGEEHEVLVVLQACMCIPSYALFRSHVCMHSHMYVWC